MVTRALGYISVCEEQVFPFRVLMALWVQMSTGAIMIFPTKQEPLASVPVFQNWHPRAPSRRSSWSFLTQLFPSSPTSYQLPGLPHFFSFKTSHVCVYVCKNVHNKTLTILTFFKCTIHWHSAHSHCATMNAIHFWNFPKLKPYIH